MTKKQNKKDIDRTKFEIHMSNGTNKHLIWIVYTEANHNDDVYIMLDNARYRDINGHYPISVPPLVGDWARFDVITRSGKYSYGMQDLNTHKDPVMAIIKVGPEGVEEIIGFEGNHSNMTYHITKK